MSQLKHAEFVLNESNFQKSVSNAPPVGWLFIQNANQNLLSVAMNQTTIQTMPNWHLESKTWKISCWIKKLHQKFLLKFILPFTQVGFDTIFRPDQASWERIISYQERGLSVEAWSQFIGKILKLLLVDERLNEEGVYRVSGSSKNVQGWFKMTKNNNTF